MSLDLIEAVAMKIVNILEATASVLCETLSRFLFIYHRNDWCQRLVWVVVWDLLMQMMCGFCFRFLLHFSWEY